MVTIGNTTYVWTNVGLQAALKVNPDGEGVEIVSDMHAVPQDVQDAMVNQALAEAALQECRAATLAERKRILAIHAVAPGGWRDPAAKLAIDTGASVEQFAYKLTLDAMAGGKKLPMPNSSSKH